MFILLLLAVPVGRVPVSCEPKRERALTYLFEEVHRVSGGDEITYEMMRRYESNMPWYGRFTIKHLAGGKGINYILERCRGSDGRITFASSMRRLDTCISRCMFASVMTKFLDWGYADYWKG